MNAVFVDLQRKTFHCQQQCSPFTDYNCGISINQINGEQHHLETTLPIWNLFMRLSFPGG